MEQAWDSVHRLAFGEVLSSLLVSDLVHPLFLHFSFNTMNPEKT